MANPNDLIRDLQRAVSEYVRDCHHEFSPENFRPFADDVRAILDSIREAMSGGYCSPGAVSVTVNVNGPTFYRTENDGAQNL